MILKRLESSQIIFFYDFPMGYHYLYFDFISFNHSCLKFQIFNKIQVFTYQSSLIYSQHLLIFHFDFPFDMTLNLHSQMIDSYIY
jgi:hypothetical protein